MSELMIADLEARCRIVEEIDANFFVEAGAGSGKTTALVDRMVAMVAGGIPVEKICAITFTVAASREFFDRFQKELSNRLAASEVPEEVKDRLRVAIRNIDLCFMGTIDAFCNQLLREHPTRAGVPTTVILAEDSVKTELYRREYARLKHGDYGPELTELYREFCSIQLKPDDAFFEGIPQFMSAHAADWVIPEKPEDWRTVFSDELGQLLAVLESVEEKQANLSETKQSFRDAKKVLPEAIRILRNYRAGVPFSDVLSALKKLSASEKLSETGGLTLSCEPEAAGIDGALFTMRGKKPVVYCLSLQQGGGIVSRLTEYQYTVTVQFLRAFAAEMSKILKEKGELSYYDYLLYIRNMLRKDAASGGALVRHIRSHYSYFLIDEFQDTDPNQAEVFFRLASEMPTENWRDSVPAPGSLFIVGDPKQSIYRFRGADVSSYLSVKRLFVPPVGEVLSLRQNFRSSSVLRHWYNSTFEALLSEETDCQSKYDAIPIEDEPDTEGVFVGVWKYATGKARNEGDVADIIRRLVDNPDILIQTRKERKEGKPPRRVQYRDIMVITWTKTPLAKCLLAMKDRGIPCRVNGRTAFSESPAFVTVADLFSALANPSDSLAVYRALRGNPFRFSREEITAWVRLGNKLALYGHENDGEDEISETLIRLNIFRKDHMMLSPAALCVALLEEYQLFVRCGTEDMEYVWFAIELLRNGADGKSCRSLTDASLFLRELAEGKKDPGKVLDLNGDPDRVYLANLHKVKGLEAPIVILAQLDGKGHAPEIHMEIDGTEQKRWALRLSGGDFGNVIYAATDRYEEEAEREAAHLDAEKIRLMYVAATRARCALLIPDPGKECVWSSLLTDDIEDLAAVLPPLEAEDEEAAATPAVMFEQDPAVRLALTEENPLRHSEAMTETWKLTVPSEVNDVDTEPVEVTRPQQVSDLPRGETSSLLAGRAIHRAMEMLVSSKAILTDDAIVSSIREEYSLENSAEATDVTAYVRNALNTVRRGGWKQESGIPSDILAELLSADEVYCEVPFCVSVGDSVMNGIMDVVYRKDDMWYVVDYKTNAEPLGLDLVYKDQMAAYRNAIGQLFGVPAAVHTYHIPLQT